MNANILYKNKQNKLAAITYDIKRKRFSNAFQPSITLQQSLEELKRTNSVQIIPADYRIIQNTYEENSDTQIKILPEPITITKSLIRNFPSLTTIYLDENVTSLEYGALADSQISDIYIKNINQVLSLHPGVFGFNKLEQANTYTSTIPYIVSMADIHISPKTLLQENFDTDIAINLDYLLLKTLANHTLNKHNYSLEEVHVKTMDSALHSLIKNIDEKYNLNTLPAELVKKMFSKQPKEIYQEGVFQSSPKFIRNEDTTFIDVLNDDFFGKDNKYKSFSSFSNHSPVKDLTKYIKNKQHESEKQNSNASDISNDEIIDLNILEIDDGKFNDIMSEFDSDFGNVADNNNDGRDI